MTNLKSGDVIVFRDIKEIVLARLEDLVFTQRIFENGSVGPVRPAVQISDLATWGWHKESGEETAYHLPGFEDLPEKLDKLNIKNEPKRP